MYEPKYLCPVNHRYNLSELFIYKPAVSKRNGVVGNPGTKIPRIPKISDIVPNTISTIFNISLLSIMSGRS